MKKIVFVLNPHSGKALIKNALLKIIQVFSEAGYDVTVYPTKAPLDGYEYLKKREGQYDVLVCSGGDGTLNEVVRAVLEYQGDKPPIGYIPSGSTNDCNQPEYSKGHGACGAAYCGRRACSM